MFWWGIAMYGATLLVQTVFFADLWVLLSSSQFLEPLRILVIGAGDLGIGLVIGSFILRGLTGPTRGNTPEVAPEVADYRE